MAGPTKYGRILSLFPDKLTLSFAYGSGVLRQGGGGGGGEKKVVDLMFAVEDSREWHRRNLALNRGHYSSVSWLGAGAVAGLQERWGGKLYYNTLVPVEGTVIKYGVISRKDLLTDLLDWCDLYAAGRLHKPVRMLTSSGDARVEAALRRNLQSAVHAALLTLPEHFTERTLYRAVAGLSYGGDPRMLMAEDRNKVDNIVSPQMDAFRRLYAPALRALGDYVHVAGDGTCWQDADPAARNYHLHQLPKTPRTGVVRMWNRATAGGPRRDIEDSLHALAFDPDCGDTVRACLAAIVRASSVGQSLKGVLTAGVAKSLRYGGSKVAKMLRSRRQRPPTSA